MNLKTLISEDELNNRIEEIAQEINKEYKDEEIVLICI